MINAKSVFKVLFIVTFVVSGLSLSACRNQSDSYIGNNEHCSEIETVKVKGGSITPTLSARASIKKASPFIVQSDNNGYFESNVYENSSVKKGQVIGGVGNSEIVAPVDAVVVKVCSEAYVPKNYPLFELMYAGFSIDVKANDFLQTSIDFKKIKARFQIQNGLGPSDVLSIVVSSDDSDTLQCLISHDDEVRLGQLATVVITAESKNDAMILPVSVVAGRFKKGLVSKVYNGEVQQVNVMLGVTDGAYIEILSGLDIGDEIQTLAPNIDPREN